MNLTSVAGKLQTIGGRRTQLAVAKVGKYSPQILTGIGIVGGVAAAVMGAKATLKVAGIKEEHDFRVALVNEKAEMEVYVTDKARSKDLTRAYLRTGLDYAKLYGPSFSLGAASIVAIIAAQGIQQKRQVALVAGIKSLESAFAAYRGRVAESIGVEKENDLFYGVTTETIEDENGKKTKVKQLTQLNDYMRVFDPSNKNYQVGNKELNFLYLKNIQNWVNDRLDARGWVYLNEVLDQLGFDQVPYGQVVGWLHKDLNNGDGYIDFGVDYFSGDQIKRFLNGEDEGIVLVFNVDGEIMSKL